MNDGNASEIECSICLEGISNRATTPCKHSFCRGCLEKWVQAKRQVNPAGAVEAGCPLCRQKFRSYKIHYTRDFVLSSGQGPAGRVEKRRRRRFRKRRQTNNTGGGETSLFSDVLLSMLANFLAGMLTKAITTVWNRMLN